MMKLLAPKMLAMKRMMLSREQKSASVISIKRESTGFSGVLRHSMIDIGIARQLGRT